MNQQKAADYRAAVIACPVMNMFRKKLDPPVTPEKLFPSLAKKKHGKRQSPQEMREYMVKMFGGKKKA